MTITTDQSTPIVFTEISGLRIGDRVQCIHSPEAGWEGEIVEFYPSNGDDVRVRIDGAFFGDGEDTLTYPFTSIEKVTPTFVEDDIEDCPLADWEKELLEVRTFAPGDIVVIEGIKGAGPEWLGRRFVVVSSDSAYTHLECEFDERGDEYGRHTFNWDTDMLRPFDPSTDFKVGDTVRIDTRDEWGHGLRLGTTAIVVHVERDGLEVDGVDDYDGTLLRQSVQFSSITLVGPSEEPVEEPVEEEVDYLFQVGDRVTIAEAHSVHFGGLSGEIIEVGMGGSGPVYYVRAEGCGVDIIGYGVGVGAFWEQALSLESLEEVEYGLGDKVEILPFGEDDLEGHSLVPGSVGEVIALDECYLTVKGINEYDLPETNILLRSEVKLFARAEAIEDFGFEAGQEIGSIDVLADLPYGSILTALDDDDPSEFYLHLTNTHGKGWVAINRMGITFVDEDLSTWMQDESALVIAYVPA